MLTSAGAFLDFVDPLLPVLPAEEDAALGAVDLADEVDAFLAVLVWPALAIGAGSTPILERYPPIFGWSLASLSRRAAKASGTSFLAGLGFFGGDRWPISRRVCR